jgi:hypothetical protein
MALGGAIIVGFAILTTVLTFATASNPTGERRPGGQGLTLAQLTYPRAALALAIYGRP